MNLHCGSTRTQTQLSHRLTREFDLLQSARQCAYPAILAAICFALSACSAFGPRQLPIDRFDYNSAIASSANQQMLLNLVRLRFTEVPTFLAVGSVITQYVWTAEAGVTGAGGESLDFPVWTVGGSANVRYIERPTITYAPLSGQEFASQLISPVRADVVFTLVSSGWPPDQLLVMTLQRVNDIQNAGFASPHSVAHTESARMNRVIELIIELAKRDSIELVRAESTERDELFLEFSQSHDAEIQALVREFKDIVGLDQDRSRFRVTRKIVGRAPDEITLRMHSLLELMGLLSAGVELPVTDAPAQIELNEPTGDRAMSPLTVHCQRDRPTEAFVAVQYDQNWYYLNRADEQSKRAFGLLIYLFQMQASQSPGAGPLLTVPTG